MRLGRVLGIVWVGVTVLSWTRYDLIGMLDWAACLAHHAKAVRHSLDQKIGDLSPIATWFGRVNR